MNPIEKLAVAVQCMRDKQVLHPPCHFLGVIRLVAEGECCPSPARNAILKQADKMLAQCRALCCEYDNLRSLVGTLEREQGVKDPRFWIGEINRTCEPHRCTQRVTMKLGAQAVNPTTA